MGAYSGGETQYWSHFKSGVTLTSYLFNGLAFHFSQKNWQKIFFRLFTFLPDKWFYQKFDLKY